MDVSRPRGGGRRDGARAAACDGRARPLLRAAGARLAGGERGRRPGGFSGQPGAAAEGRVRAGPVRGAGRAVRSGDLRRGARQPVACGPGHRRTQPRRAARAHRRGPVRPGTTRGACCQRLCGASRLPRLARLGLPGRLAGHRAHQPCSRALAGRPARLRRPAAGRGDAALVLRGADGPLPRLHWVVRLRDRAAGVPRRRARDQRGP